MIIRETSMFADVAHMILQTKGGNLEGTRGLVGFIAARQETC